MKKNVLHRLCGVVLAVVMTVTATQLLLGCSLIGWIFGGDGYIMFTRGNITLQAGDSYDVSSIVDSDSSYTLSSADTSVVTVSGKKITARSVGTTFVTAETSYASDRIRVTVTDVEPDSLSLDADGELIQTMGETSEVAFTPIAKGSIVSKAVDWYVNGERVDTKLAGDVFTFVPSAAGAYVVKAEAGVYSDEKTVRCYYPVSAEVTASGELEQTSQPYSAVNFSVDVERNNRNPDDYIEWYDGDALLYAGAVTSYMYRPTPGRHTIRAYVNGKHVYTADGFFRGSVTPSKPNIVFDNSFSHVYIECDAVGLAAVEISSPLGTVTEYKQSDPRYASLFTEYGFDAGEFISLCATSNMRRSYTVRVKSLGDGDVYTESGYSVEATFTQLAPTAKRYIETFYLGSDGYVTSEREFVELFEYHVINRKKTAGATVAFDCYIAFDYDGDANDLWNDAFPIAATSGTYKNITSSINNRVFRTSFNVDTVNRPTRQAVESSGYRRAEQLHAILPHINYDEDKYRTGENIFYIDNVSRTANVTYTDELYLAVERGVRPLPAAGSAADTVYDLARDVLRKICTDDMTDEQKAHAIYDWIMWKVAYDTPATRGSGGEDYSAYYLEGVFADGKTPIGGVVYEPYAVCDGMSKAYSLLCNMEGVPCVRVVGTAGSSADDAGGHAWNKVFVNGGWYVVDCTWGDAVAAIDLGGFVKTDCELGLHDNLFLTEAQIEGDHFEPYMSGESSIVYAPVASEKRYNVYERMEFDGVTIDSSVKRTQDAEARVREIVARYAEACRRLDSVIVPGIATPSRINYRGFEIYFDGGVDMSDGEIASLVSSALRTARPELRARTFVMNNIVLVLMYKA